MIKKIIYRPPNSEDGFAVNQLIFKSPPLDNNSLYCNLLQCTHFRDTCILGELDDEVIGFVSAYRLPEETSTLFIWQVVVSDTVRGQGVGFSLLEKLLASPACGGVTHIDTTITESNQASRKLFEKLAHQLGCNIQESTFFDKAKHFNDQHDSEPLLRIGPFAPDLQTI